MKVYYFCDRLEADVVEAIERQRQELDVESVYVHRLSARTEDMNLVIKYRVVEPLVCVVVHGHKRLARWCRIPELEELRRVTGG